MSRKISLFILFLTFCFSFNGSFCYLENIDFPSLSSHPSKAFQYEIFQFKAIVSKYPKFDSISQSLSKVDRFNEEYLMDLCETEKTLEMLWMTLNSTHEKYLFVEPAQHERAIQEKANDLNPRLANMQASYDKLKEEMKNTPLHQLSDGSGKIFEELSLQIRNLQHEAADCSVERYRLLDELERAELKNNAAHKEIDELERLIELKRNQRDKNDAHLGSLDREFQEELLEFENDLKKIQARCTADFFNQKKAVLESSEEKMKKIDQKIFEMEVKATELKAKSQESSISENLLNDIAKEISRLQSRKKFELQEKHQILKRIRQIFDESIASLHDEKMRTKKEQSLLQELERKKSSLEMENERIQLEIDDLSSRKNKIFIFPAKLDSLRHHYVEKKRECLNIEVRILQRKEEREMLETDESLEVGVQTQRELVKKGEKFADFQHSVIQYFEFQLYKLHLQVYGVQMNLENLPFEQLRENIIFNADLHLSKVYKKDSCKEIADCLQEIFTEKFQSKAFDTQIPISTLLSMIFTGTKSVRSILKEENSTISHDLQDLIKAKLLFLKESSWSLASLLNYFLRTILGSDLINFVKVGEGELENEVRKAKTIFNLAVQDIKVEYDKFILNSWRNNLEEMSKPIINILEGANNLTALDQTFVCSSLNC